MTSTTTSLTTYRVAPLGDGSASLASKITDSPLPPGA